MTLFTPFVTWFNALHSYNMFCDIWQFVDKATTNEEAIVNKVKYWQSETKIQNWNQNKSLRLLRLNPRLDLDRNEGRLYLF